MSVHETIDLGNGHLIEIGQATWDPSMISVCHRFPTTTGGLGPTTPGEIPIADLGALLAAVARWDLFDAEEPAR